MDAAIPLGIVVNELVTNSIKHAFPTGRGEIQINLCESESEKTRNDSPNLVEDCVEKNSFQYLLEVSDNGKGISEEVLDNENSNSLGLQLVKILVEQIDGYLEVKNDKGAHFTIWFNNIIV